MSIRTITYPQPMATEILFQNANAIPYIDGDPAAWGTRLPDDADDLRYGYGELVALYASEEVYEGWSRLRENDSKMAAFLSKYGYSSLEDVPFGCVVGFLRIVESGPLLIFFSEVIRLDKPVRAKPGESKDWEWEYPDSLAPLLAYHALF